MKKIEIDGNVGDEVTLVYGDKTLVVKLSEDGIVPDFVDAFYNAFDYAAFDIMNSESAKYHRNRDAEQRLRYALSVARDRLFESIKPIVEAVEDEPEIDETEEPTQTDDETEEEETVPEPVKKTTSRKTMGGKADA